MDLEGVLISADVFDVGEATTSFEAACRIACCNLTHVCKGYSFDASLGRVVGRTVCSLYSDVTQLVPNSNTASGISRSVL
jgi:hypothetical protein